MSDNGEHTYKGYAIDPAPYLDPETGRWMMRYFLAPPGRNAGQPREVSGSERFESEAEARAHCLSHARLVIDVNDREAQRHGSAPAVIL